MKFKNLAILGAFTLLFVQCANKTAQFKGATEGERLNNFFEWSFNQLIKRQPEEMSYLGMKEGQDRLNDESHAYRQETLGLVKEHLSILESFDRDDLNSEDQLSYDLYKIQANVMIRKQEWKDYEYSVNQMFGIHAHLPNFMTSIHKIKNQKDAQNYISRLNQFKNILSDVVNNMMRSESKGVVIPKFVFPKVVKDSENIIKGYPFDKSKKDSVLMADFRKKLNDLKLKNAEKKKLMDGATQALKTSVQPGYENLIVFLKKQETRATTDDGAWKFPMGREYYKYRLREMTTTDLTPEQVHQLGLDNVKRIHNEMKIIMKKVGFKGSLQEFFAHLQTSKYLFGANPSGRKKYLKKAKGLISDMRKSLDKMFITQPKAPIVVRPVEAFREKSAGMAFYQNGTPDGTRPGTYYVNLSNMAALPKWEAAALAYHEGIPGHHMQISIAQELQKVPKFRRHVTHFTAYVEGWGLYSERLPKEFGFYKDPYSDFGRLSMELTRAARLVVDTGIHWKKWTRKQAIDYLDINTAGDHGDHVRQINRYIVMPGQATAYMVGMLKILELREMAKKKMGKKFDIRKFHDLILTGGAVPLDVLEKRVIEFTKG